MGRPTAGSLKVKFFTQKKRPRYGTENQSEWYDKRTEMGEGEELSKDFGDDGSVIEALGMPVENNVNNGGFDVRPDWVCILQAHFQHAIEPLAYDYQVAFVYRDSW